MSARVRQFVAVGAALSLLAGVARAEPDVVLRVSSVAPEGSSWAREFAAFGRAVEGATNGHVRIKWYLNGVAGDELEQEERLRRGQLDGATSGQMLCERVAPSMRLTRLPGVFQNRDEATDVLARLQPRLEAEAHQAGFVLPITVSMGPDVIFSRTPIRTMDELKKAHLWRWDLDEVGIATSRDMGMQATPVPIFAAASAYDGGKLDGFLAIPTAALAFQWTAQARYLTDLRGSYLWGCLVFSERAFGKLAISQQQAIRSAAAQMGARFDDVQRQVDEALLGGLLRKQGVQPVPPSAGFRAEYFAAARATRERIGAQLVGKDLLDKALRMLADYRAEHPLPAGH